MTIETEQSEALRRSRESQESKTESKEGEVSEELKAGAAMERADIIVKEVKQSKKQMQNIVVHMQTVLATIRQLRQQLQLVQNTDDPESIKLDKKRVEELTKKIRVYGDELEKMKTDLIREQMEELKNGVGVGMSTDELARKAGEMVEEMIAQVKSS